MTPEAQRELLQFALEYLWGILPALVIALVTFSFKRLTARVLGVFEQTKAVQEDVGDLKKQFEMQATLAQEQRSVGAERLARIEATLAEQTRRIDAIARRE